MSHRVVLTAPFVFAFVFAFILASPLCAQDVAGTWFTSRGVLELEGKGNELTGRYGDGASLRATRAGKDLKVEARESQTPLQATLVLDKNGFRFAGEWTSANGKGRWRGWRHDPASEKAKAAPVAGFWRTSRGLLELEQKGNKLEGGFGAQGWSKVKGELKGRSIQLDYENPFG